MEAGEWKAEGGFKGSSSDCCPGVWLGRVRQGRLPVALTPSAMWGGRIDGPGAGQPAAFVPRRGRLAFESPVRVKGTGLKIVA